MSYISCYNAFCFDQLYSVKFSNVVSITSCYYGVIGPISQVLTLYGYCRPYRYNRRFFENIIVICYHVWVNFYCLVIIFVMLLALPEVNTIDSFVCIFIACL